MKKGDIRVLSINKGDIVTVTESIYVDFPGGKWEDHFVSRKMHYIAMEIPSNNGNFKGRNFKGRIKWLNTGDVISVKRKI